MTNLKWYELDKNRWQDRGTIYSRTYVDSQRIRVYRAEWWVEATLPVNCKFKSIKEIQTFIDNLFNEVWFKTRWKISAPKVMEITGRTAYAIRDDEIHLPQWGWNKITVLHELSHIVHPHNYGTPHGRYFCRTFLALVGHKIGHKFAKDLKKEFIKRNVRSTPYPIFSAETLQKKQEQGRKMAAKLHNLQTV